MKLILSNLISNAIKNPHSSGLFVSREPYIENSHPEEQEKLAQSFLEMLLQTPRVQEQPLGQVCFSEHEKLLLSF